MRLPRAILFDDDQMVLGMLTMFFEDRGYEVIASAEPVGCPVYTDAASCHQRGPCGDLMITDLVMPGMSGLDLLAMQAARGCGLDARNKAVLSGSLDDEALAAVARLGCRAFHKPVRLAELLAWVVECEQRMDLQRPLGARRRERRESGGSEALIALAEGPSRVAEVVNRSGSGSCLRVDHPLEVGQFVDLQPGCLSGQARAQVRWSTPETGGRYLAGFSCD